MTYSVDIICLFQFLRILTYSKYMSGYLFGYICKYACVFGIWFNLTGYVFSTVGERLSVLGCSVVTWLSMWVSTHCESLFSCPRPRHSLLCLSWIQLSNSQRSRDKTMNPVRRGGRVQPPDSLRLPRPTAAIISKRAVSLCLGDTETSERQTNRNTYDKLNMMA